MELLTGDSRSGGEVVGAVDERVRDEEVIGDGRKGDGGVVEEKEERCVIERRQAVD